MFDKIKPVLKNIVPWIGWLLLLLQKLQDFIVENPIPGDLPADSLVSSLLRIVGIG